jgi:hypothetical protein
MKISKQKLARIIKEEMEVTIDEGIWDSIKHRLSKLGSLEKGGKIFGRGKAKEEADAELQAILDKADEASNRTIKALYNDVQEKYPEFPNQKDPKEYALALTDIYIFYDSLAQAAKKKPDEKGAFPCAAANELITDLRKVVKKWTDYDLADVYKHLTEEQKRLLAEAAGDDKILDELFGSREKKWEKIASGELDVDEKGKTVKPAAAAGEQEKTSRLGGGELSTIEGLKSNLLPGALGLAGGAALIAAYIASQPAFVNWLAGKLGAGQGLNPKTLVGEITPAIDKTIGPLNGEGFTQMFGRMKGAAEGAGGTFTSDTPVSSLFKEFGKYGIDPKNPSALFELGVDKASYMERLASGATSIGEMFPAGDKGLWLELGKKTTVTVAKAITKKVVQGAGGAVAGTALATGTAALAGPLLTGLGIALVTSAAAIKLIRMKGIKSSRAKSLKDLFDALVPIECEDGPGPEPEDPCKDKPGTKWNPETKECEEDIEIVDPPKDQDITIIDTNTWIQLVQQITKNETNQTVINNITNITNNIEKHDTTVNVDDRDIVQNIIKVTQKNDLDINNTQLSQTQINQLIQILGRKDDLIIGPPKDPETPEDPTTEDTRKVMKPILIRYDNDEIKIYAPTIRSKEKGKEYIAAMKDAEKKGLIGNEVSSALNEIFAEELTEDIEITEADTGETEKTLGTRGFRWDPDKKGALTMAKLNKRYKKRRKNKRTGQITQTTPKYFFTFDKSLIPALEPLDIGPSETRAIAKLLIKILKRNKKITVSQKQLTNLVSKIEKAMPNIAGDADGLTKILSDFSVTIPSKNEKLQEALVTSRWKVLSGIR